MREKSNLSIRVISFFIAVSLALLVFSTFAGASPSTDIWDWHDLHAVRENLGGNYRLMNNLDAITAGYMELASATANEGRGWQPIGTSTGAFTGSFNGQGHEITDLFARRPADKGAGLFGHVGLAGIVDAVGVVNASVAADSYVGCLVGWNEGAVSNSYSSGSVTGDLSVGGLVGVANQGRVSNSYSTASVNGNGAIGGLVGWNNGTVHNSYSNGNVTGNSSVGGLVGHNVGDLQGGTVSNSYAAGRVTGESRVGGLIGYNLRGTVSSSFWDVETSGVSISDGGTGKSTAEMMRIATFIETGIDGLDQPWDMTAVDPGEINDACAWNIIDGAGLPFLSGKPLIQYSLAISSSEGGQVTTPGEETLPYDADIVVNLMAEAEEGHRFISWTGDVDTIDNVNAAVTTVTMQSSYTIRANFEEALPAAANLPLIGGIVAALAVAGLLVFLKRRSRPAPTKKRRRT